MGIKYQESIKLFPNPMNSNLIIELANNKATLNQIQIVNLTRIEVFEKVINAAYTLLNRNFTWLFNKKMYF